MEIKRGSVTPVDLTGQADGDYIRNDAGVWKPKTARNVLADLLPLAKWDSLKPRDYTETGVTGTSTIGATRPFYGLLYTGVTSNSTLYFRVSRFSGLSRSEAHTVVDFDKLIVWKFRIASAGQTTGTGIIWGMVGGCLENAAAGDPTHKAFGIKVIGTAIHGTVHDGATQNTVDLSTAFANNPQDILIISLAGNVQWYVDNVYKGVSNNGPTGDSTGSYNPVGYSMTNGANAAAHRLNIYDAKLYVGV